MKEVREKIISGIKIKGEKTMMLRFAENIIFLTENTDLGNILNVIHIFLKNKYGLKINIAKTRAMNSSRNVAICEFFIVSSTILSNTR